MQNLLARFDVETGALRGFVYRDMGGLRMHVPTMEARGVRIKSADLVPGAVVLTDDLEAVWANAYHSFENHMGGALRGLGLQWEGGWDIVREELKAALDASPDPDGRAAKLLEFMIQPTVKRKAFLRMKIAGVYRGVSINEPLGWVPHLLTKVCSRECIRGFQILYPYKERDRPRLTHRRA
jgi:siderophore synthetase component